MTLDDITIENMVWVNEFSEAQVAQELVRGVTGNPILYEQAQPLGTPMRLTGAWVDRQTGQALRAKAICEGSKSRFYHGMTLFDLRAGRC